MKFIIDGRTYDGQLQPFIGDLRLLKPEFGFGWATVAERLSAIEQDSKLITLLEDEQFLDAFVAWLWMSRLRAGDRDVTRADIEMLALDQMQIIGDEPTTADDGDGEQAAPTSAPTGSARGDEAAPAPQQRHGSSTKTSKKRSTAASS